MSYRVSVLIPCYNEAENIRALLRRLVRQRLSEGFCLEEIVVVASGCTDGTEQIVREFEGDGRVRLLVQKEREGKASAINLFLSHTDADIIVMESADTLPEDYAINNLLKPFRNDCVGMTAGRPVPLNNSRELMTMINGSLWHLHHKISTGCPPKVGELVAFRNIISSVPEKSAADEESISAVIQQSGYQVVYTPAAVVYNKGPESIPELFEQRKRIFGGHLWIRRNQGYTVPSLDAVRLARVLFWEIVKNPKKLFTLAPLIFLEIVARLCALYETIVKKEVENKWQRLPSTKRLIG